MTKTSNKMDYFEFTLDLVHWPLLQCRVINNFSVNEFLGEWKIFKMNFYYILKF